MVALQWRTTFIGVIQAQVQEQQEFNLTVSLSHLRRHCLVLSCVVMSFNYSSFHYFFLQSCRLAFFFFLSFQPIRLFAKVFFPTRKCFSFAFVSFQVKVNNLRRAINLISSSSLLRLHLSHFNLDPAESEDPKALLHRSKQSDEGDNEDHHDDIDSNSNNYNDNSFDSKYVDDINNNNGDGNGSNDISETQTRQQQQQPLQKLPQQRKHHTL